MRLLTRWLEDARSKPDTGYVDICDGIRVLAIGIVAWFHIWQQSWLWPGFTLFGVRIDLDPVIRSGYMWVDIMILISGFCHYLPWARLEDGAPDPSALVFYRKRIARILPSYVLAVVVCFLGALGAGIFYRTGAQAAKDLAAHLTFTNVFFYDTYYGTPINAGLWTIAVEMHFYLLFPLIAKAFRRLPGATAAAMIAAALSFRGWAAANRTDVSLLFNQLIAYLDIFALGMLTALLHVKLSHTKRGPASRILCSVLAVGAFLLLLRLGREQSKCPNVDAIRLGQMQRRLAMGICGSLLLLFGANAGLCLRKLLANPVMRFLSGISMQFYIWHQVLAVQIKWLRVIPSAFEDPNFAGDIIWQKQYTLMCVLAALAVSTLLTYGFEHPIARRMLRGANGRRKKAG
ncbi:MAG: acyltransferase [Clostridia bacterium]|nr:acyltransferase [Clostridia bacterium]